jgi:hypothetical protein
LDKNKSSSVRGGNVGIAERFPRAVESGGKPDFGFPPLSMARHFHGALVKYGF